MAQAGQCLFPAFVTPDPAALLRASELLTTEVGASDVTVNLVCGGPWDAYVLIFDKPELFFDIGFHGDAPLEEATPAFESILVHELWHQAFLDHRRRHWPVDHRHSDDPATRVLYRMLNEGVGHYYSLHRKLYPKVAYEDFAARERAVFSLLARNYPAYRAETDEKTREALLWHSHAGVPFWQKWGAVPGALVVFHVAEALGLDAVRALIREEPFRLFIRYGELASADPALPALPAELLDDARSGLEKQRSTRRLDGGGLTPDPAESR